MRVAALDQPTICNEAFPGKLVSKEVWPVSRKQRIRQISPSYRISIVPDEKQRACPEMVTREGGSPANLDLQVVVRIQRPYSTS